MKRTIISESVTIMKSYIVDLDLPEKNLSCKVICQTMSGIDKDGKKFVDIDMCDYQDMVNLTESSRDYIKMLRGSEVLSLKYEGCVYINGVGEVYMDGEKVDTLDTNSKVKKLWKEYLKSDGL